MPARVRCPTSTSRRARPSPSNTSPASRGPRYNWYKGNLRSVIQVNTDLPLAVDRAIDLACHEGYPGHHVYNALLEQRLVKGAAGASSPSIRSSARSR